MTKQIFPAVLTAAVIAITSVTACKPSEQHYRTAYESAVAKRDAGNIDQTIYNRFREMARTNAIALGNGDTLAVQTEFIGYPENGGASRETTQRYNIVVGQFKQIFNAREMRKRLMTIGYENPFILQTREPIYYVVTATCPTATEALQQLRRVEADTAMCLRAPMPFVLQPAHMVR